MNKSSFIVLALLSTMGCYGIDRISGHTESDGAVFAQPTGDVRITGNAVTNPNFRNWIYGASFQGPIETFTPICEGWVSMYGGEGAHAHYKVSQDPNGVRFDVYGFDDGDLRRGERITQFIPEWQKYVGKTIDVTVTVKTNIVGHVQFAIDAGPGGDVGHKYSAMAQGTGQWETLSVRFTVPPDANFLWLKIGQTSGFHPEVGWFVVKAAAVTVFQ